MIGHTLRATSTTLVFYQAFENPSDNRISSKSFSFQGFDLCYSGRLSRQYDQDDNVLDRIPACHNSTNTITQGACLLEVAEFRSLLEKGLGRTVLFLQSHDVAPYREQILHACTHDLT